MTGEMEKIRTKIGMMMWDGDMHPVVTPNGFHITVDGTNVLVTIKKVGE